jgi:hypothetical protein
VEKGGTFYKALCPYTQTVVPPLHIYYELIDLNLRISTEKDWFRFAELGVDPIVSYQWAQLIFFYIPSPSKSLADYCLDNLQAGPSLRLLNALLTMEVIGQ